MTQQREDSSIDFIFHTAGRVTDDGFVVEMAIPFSSLRFPDRPVQTWRVMLVRTYPRSSRHYLSWPSLSQNNPCQLCQLARLDGIEGVRPGGTLEILPAFVASQSGRLRDPSDPTSFENGRVTAEPSLGLKYAFQQRLDGRGDPEPRLQPGGIRRGAGGREHHLRPVLSRAAPLLPGRDGPLSDAADRLLLALHQLPAGGDEADGRIGDHRHRLHRRAGRAHSHHRSVRGVQPGAAGWPELHQRAPPAAEPGRLARGRAAHRPAPGRRRLRDHGGRRTRWFRFREMYSVTAHLVGSYTREPDDEELSARLPEPHLRRGSETGYTAKFDGESFAAAPGRCSSPANARTWSWNVIYMRGIADVPGGRRVPESQRLPTALTGWTGTSTSIPTGTASSGSPPTSGGGGAGTSTARGRRPGSRRGSAPRCRGRRTSASTPTSAQETVPRGAVTTGFAATGLWMNSNFSDPPRWAPTWAPGARSPARWQTPELGNGEPTPAPGAHPQAAAAVVLEPS
jgi:hypothetical protein